MGEEVREEEGIGNEADCSPEGENEMGSLFRGFLSFSCRDLKESSRNLKRGLK